VIQIRSIIAAAGPKGPIPRAPLATNLELPPAGPQGPQGPQDPVWDDQLGDRQKPQLTIQTVAVRTKFVPAIMIM
jgi:hypothetical protein